MSASVKYAKQEGTMFMMNLVHAQQEIGWFCREVSYSLIST